MTTTKTKKNKSSIIQLGIGVGVILLNHKDQIPTILLGRRRSLDGFGNGEWSLPGGKPDLLENEGRYENTQETAIREVFEETGLKIKNLCRVYFSDDHFPVVGKQFVTVYFTAEVDRENWSIEDVSNKEPDKCFEWRMFPINALPSPLFCGVKEALDFWSWSREISVIEAIVGGGKEVMTPYLEPVIRLKDYFNQLSIKKTKDGKIALIKKIDEVKKATMKRVPEKLKWTLGKKH